MKATAISFFLFILLLPSAHSQVRFGVKSALSTSGVSGNIDTKNVSGFTLGPTVEAMINERFGAQASLLFAKKGIQVKGQSKQSTSYLEVPTSLKMAIPVSENIKPYINGGPYVGFKIPMEDRMVHSWIEFRCGSGIPQLSPTGCQLWIWIDRQLQIQRRKLFGEGSNLVFHGNCLFLSKEISNKNDLSSQKCVSW